MHEYLTMETMTFISEQENALLERIKKYFTDNKELILIGLTTMCKDYHAPYAYNIMQHK